MTKAVKLVESILDILKDTLEAGEGIKISCFVAFTSARRLIE